jgi:hypothetical protein
MKAAGAPKWAPYSVVVRRLAAAARENTEQCEDDDDDDDPQDDAEDAPPLDDRRSRSVHCDGQTCGPLHRGPWPRSNLYVSMRRSATRLLANSRSTPTKSSLPSSPESDQTIRTGPIEPADAGSPRSRPAARVSCAGSESWR